MDTSYKVPSKHKLSYFICQNFIHKPYMIHSRTQNYLLSLELSYTIFTVAILDRFDRRNEIAIGIIIVFQKIDISYSFYCIEGARCFYLVCDSNIFIISVLSSPARRINPFDRSPNLPPHLAAQLNNNSSRSFLWSLPIFR